MPTPPPAETLTFDVTHHGGPPQSFLRVEAPEPAPAAAAPGARRHLVYFVAVGQPHADLAALAVRSLRNAGYRGGVLVIADRPVDVDGVDAEVRVIEPEPVDGRGDDDAAALGAMHLKPQVGRWADLGAYDYVLYLDADVLTVQDPTPVLDALAAAGRVAAQRGRRTIATFGRYLSHDLYEARRDDPHPCTGIVGVPTSAEGRQVLADWLDYCRRLGCRDQTAFTTSYVERHFGRLDWIPGAAFVEADPADSPPPPGTVFLHFIQHSKQWLPAHYRRLWRDDPP